MEESLTGHVEPLRRDGAVVRGRWRLVVNLPRVRRGDDWRHPRRVRTVEASGVREAERKLRHWIGELDSHRKTK